MSDYIADWDGRLIHRPARPQRNPRLVIDTNGDHVERIAWLHGVTVEADATHKFATYAGITYRAELMAGAA
jgi:hypothetical protein